MYDTVIQTTLDIYNAKSSLKQIKYNVQDILSFIKTINENFTVDLVIRCVLYITYYNHFDDDLFMLIVSDTNSDTYSKLCKLIRVNYFNAILSKQILAL